MKRLTPFLMFAAGAIFGVLALYAYGQPKAPAAVPVQADPFAVDPFAAPAEHGKCGPDRCGDRCKCCPACGTGKPCQCEKCKCCPGCAFDKVVDKRTPAAPKSAYYVAYHQAVAEKRAMVTKRGYYDVRIAEELARRNNAVLGVIPAEDDRVPYGIVLWLYVNGDLVTYKQPAPVAPLYRPAPASFAPANCSGGR